MRPSGGSLANRLRSVHRPIPMWDRDVALGDSGARLPFIASQ